MESLQPGNIYHICNRGVNGSTLFVENRNYDYFMLKFRQYCSAITDLYAYSLLPTHFHMLVKIHQPMILVKDTDNSKKIITAPKQLSHFFNCYAQTINKTYMRHGSLLESPFRRKQIKNRDELRNLVCFIHQNAERHGLVRNFRDWPHSSWHALVHGTQKIINRSEVLAWFETAENMQSEHRKNNWHSTFVSVCDDF